MSREWWIEKEVAHNEYEILSEKYQKAVEAKEAWRKLSMLQDKLLVCYRTHRPPGKWLYDFDEVRQTLRELGEEETK